MDERDMLLAEIEQHCNTLKQLPTTTLYPFDDERYECRGILIASTRRVLQQAHAVMIVSKLDLAEEVHALARMLVEMVVNALYIQIAPTQERQSFMAFDRQKIAYELRKKDEVIPDSAEWQAIEADLVKLRQTTGRKDKDQSWSKRSLKERAQLVDEISGLPILKLLATNASLLANMAVHGTFMSIAGFLPIEGAETWVSQRDRFHIQALSFTNHALLALHRLRTDIQMGDDRGMGVRPGL